MSRSSGATPTGPQRKPALARLDAGELENLLDHLGQPPALGRASARRSA